MPTVKWCLECREATQSHSKVHLWLSHCLSATQISIVYLTQCILDVSGTQGRLEVLLVGEDQERDVLVVLVLHCPPQLHLGLVQLVSLGAVHHEDDPVRAPG